MRCAFLALLCFPLFASGQAAPEHLSPYGLAKPLLIVADALPKEFANKDQLPVLSVKQDQAPPGFQFLKQADEQPMAGYVGIHLSPDAILKMQKRTLSNAGQGAVTLRLAKSPTREARSITLNGTATADYNEVRRVAMERAAGSPYPPKKVATPNVPQGTLVIIGGGGTTPEINKRYLEAGGGADGHFVVLPISMPDPINVDREAGFLKRMGAKNVTVLPYREQKDLEDPKVLAVLEKATGLWFGGGRQWNFMDAYEGTKLPALFRKVLDRGGVIGGSSAGATIQGDYMVRGAPAGPQIMMCEGYERALGFLPGVAIDQHFSARNRFKDMTSFMKTYPQFLGIGLDEATAIVVQGSTAEVVGKGKVHFYDYKRPIKAGEPDYEAFAQGTTYDLAKRMKIADQPNKK